MRVGFWEVGVGFEMVVGLKNFWTSKGGFVGFGFGFPGEAMKESDEFDKTQICKSSISDQKRGIWDQYLEWKMKN